MDDLVIQGGWVVDGTGAPRRTADIAVTSGRVTEITTPGEAQGRSYIDADGLIVAPGFIDVHTHYDAQLTWDAAATPSSLHGVTTVIGGNCGFSLAPMDDKAAEYLVPMLAKVEGMSERALRAGLSVTWNDFRGFLDALEGRMAVNAGFLVGHSAVRRTVMGDAAVGSRADDTAFREMIRLVHESIEAGALGFSTSRGEAHLDHEGAPVPSRHASVAETLALCRATGEHPGTSLEAIPTLAQLFDPEATMFLVAMSLAARRPVNWNSLTLEQETAARQSRLEASVAGRAAGAKVIALAPCQPTYSRRTLANPFLWESIPGWGATMKLPVPARLAAFRNPAVREALRAGAAQINRKWVNWPAYRVNDTTDPALADLVGRTVGEIAAERGCDPFETFCDIAVESGLLVGWASPTIGDDDDGWKRLVELCRNPNVVVGASDAGAHVDMIATFAMYTDFLAEAVRKRGLVPLEEAIALLTAAPARLYGLRGRGTLAPGGAADIVIFDEATIGHGSAEMRNDLPAGADRIFCEAVGIREILVNGTVTVREGTLTGATPGQTIRSSRDTATPDMN